MAVPERAIMPQSHRLSPLGDRTLLKPRLPQRAHPHATSFPLPASPAPRARLRSRTMRLYRLLVAAALAVAPAACVNVVHTQPAPTGRFAGLARVAKAPMPE